VLNLDRSQPDSKDAIGWPLRTTELKEEIGRSPAGL
jgi:hypothetical protein